MSNVLYSSRRRPQQRRRAAQQFDGSLPDWVWGAGLGVVVMIFVGGFFLFSQCNSAAGSCSSPLPTITFNNITADNFNMADAGMAQVIASLGQGDKTTASNTLYGAGGGANIGTSFSAHVYIHSENGEVFNKDKTLGKTMCTDLIKFENDMETPSVATTTLIAEARTVRVDLGNDAAALGFPKPTGS